MDQESKTIMCHQCGGTGYNRDDSGMGYRCVQCGAHITIEKGKKSISVYGSNSEEVEQVSIALSGQNNETDKRTRVDRVKLIVEWAKSQRILAIVIVIFLVVIGLAKFTDAIGTLTSFYESISSDDEGWYLSRANQSCNTECTSHAGLECGRNSEVEMNKVTSLGRVRTVASLILNGSELDKLCSNFDGDPAPYAPFKLTGGGYEDRCEWKKGDDIVTCEAKEINNNNKYQRFCYCQKKI